MKIYQNSGAWFHVMSNSFSKRYAKRSNPLGFGFSVLGSMVIGPAVRIITLPYSDTQRVIEVELITEDSRVARLVISYGPSGPMVELMSGDLNRKVRHMLPAT